MSTERTSPLHKHVHQRFKEVFGTPSSTLGRDDHWALLPVPQGVSINVLVNGMPELPAVWIFDPHDRNDGVTRFAVKDEDQLEEIITQIQDRVKQAASKSPNGGIPSA